MATTTLVVAANAPDIDVLAFVHGPYFALEFRRGITHGWPAAIVLSAVVAAVVLCWDRWVRRRWQPAVEPARAGPVLGLATLGVFSHPALDWTNTYGVRWGMPFQSDWSYGDVLFIIDPWIWLVLGGALFLSARPTRGRTALWGALAAATTTLVLMAPVAPAVKVSWLLGVGVCVVARVGRRTPVRGSTAGRWALGLVSAHILAGTVADEIARADVRTEAVAAGLDVRDVMVAPRPGTPFSSDVEVRTPAGYVPGSHRWGRSPRVTLRPGALVREISAEDATDRPAVLARVLEAARTDPDVRSYLVWSRYPVIRITPRDGGWRVRVQDARYDDQGSGSLSGVETLVDAPLPPTFEDPR